MSEKISLDSSDTIFNCADVPNYIHLTGCPNARFIASISALCHISCLKHQDSASYLLLATGCLKGIGSKFSDKIRLSRGISCGYLSVHPLWRLSRSGHTAVWCVCICLRF